MGTDDLLDAAIRAEYSAFGIGADKIVCNPQLLSDFTDIVNSHLATPATTATVADRLITLRKRGAEKGGLPRTQRKFNGRRVAK